MKYVTMKTYRIEVYEAKDGWRWRMKARNGRIVADSAEAYVSERNAHRAAEEMVDAFKYVVIKR